MTFYDRYMLVESSDVLRKKNKISPLKIAGLASLGGMVGAGLDTYLGGSVDVQDFIKPMAAWGAGGAIGGMGDYFNKKKEEAEKYLTENDKLKKEVSDFRTTDLLPYGIGDSYAGFKVGSKHGYPLLGGMLAPEGVVGALSNKDKDISMKVVYSKKNILKKLAQGGVAGAIPGALGGPSGAALSGLLGAVYTAGLLPGIRYQIGKSITKPEIGKTKKIKDNIVSI